VIMPRFGTGTNASPLTAEAPRPGSLPRGASGSHRRPCAPRPHLDPARIRMVEVVGNSTAGLDPAPSARMHHQRVGLRLGMTVGQIEDAVDVGRRQALDREQMAVPERGRGGAFLHKLGTIRGAVALSNNDAGTEKQPGGPPGQPQAGATADAAAGPEALGPKPKTSRPATQHRIYPYLLRGVRIDRPDQV